MPRKAKLENQAQQDTKALRVHRVESSGQPLQIVVPTICLSLPRLPLGVKGSRVIPLNSLLPEKNLIGTAEEPYPPPGLRQPHPNFTPRERVVVPKEYEMQNPGPAGAT